MCHALSAVDETELGATVSYVIATAELAVGPLPSKSLSLIFKLWLAPSVRLVGQVEQVWVVEKLSIDQAQLVASHPALASVQLFVRAGRVLAL